MHYVFGEIPQIYLCIKFDPQKIGDLMIPVIPLSLNNHSVSWQSRFFPNKHFSMLQFSGPSIGKRSNSR